MAKYQSLNIFQADVRDMLIVRSMRLMRQVIPSIDNTAGNITMTGAMLISGLLERNPSGASRTDSFPTVSALMAALRAARITPFVGMNWEFTIVNMASAAQTITIGTAPTGCTFKPPSLGTIAQNASKTFIICITAIGASPAYTIYGMT